MRDTKIDTLLNIIEGGKCSQYFCDDKSFEPSHYA